MDEQATTTPTALVSGASSGIGRAITSVLAEEGYHVFAGVRRLADAPTTATHQRGRIEPVLLDVTDDGTVAAERDQVRRSLSGRPLGVLVNNAGIGVLAPMESVGIDELRAVRDVNVAGVVRLTQAMLPAMARGSRLIVIGSVGDRVTMPFGGPLTSSKWAVASIAEAFRLELASRGIRVTIVEPGSIRSDAVEKIRLAVDRDVVRLRARDAALAELFRRAAAVAIRNEANGSAPAVVAAEVSRCLSARRPPRRALVGRHARLLAGAAAVLPDPVLDRLRLRLRLRLFRMT